MERNTIAQTVKAFVLEEFLPGENSSSIDETTPLISGGIIDSIGTIKLVDFLETTYHIQFKAHEFGDNLDNIASIVSIVEKKASQ
jgi:acyl carrier protein